MSSSSSDTSTADYGGVIYELAVPLRGRASRMAKIAHEEHFSSRRGTFEPDDSGLIDLFDNNPYELRDKQIRLLAALLSEAGHKVVGKGCYPEHGHDEGYTICLTIRPATDRQAAENEIARRWEEIIRDTRGDGHDA